MNKTALILLIGSMGMSLLSQSTEKELVKRKQITCPIVKIAPVVDGKVDLHEWKDASIGRNFLQVMTKTNTADQKTDYYVLSTDKALYIGIQCKQENPENLSSKFTKRDDKIWADDCAEVFIDPDKSRNLSYHVIVNPAGAVYDAKEILEEGGTHRIIGNASWNMTGKVAAWKLPDGWSCEIELPYSDMKTMPETGKTMGLNVGRECKSPGEISTWNKTPVFQHPEFFGELKFVSDVSEKTMEPLMEFKSANEINADRNKGKRKYNFQYAFDFGTSNSPVHESFRQVTEESKYDESTGFGWIENSGLKSFSEMKEEKKIFDSYQNRIVKLGGKSDCITGDGIYGKKEASFRINVPDGEYRLKFYGGAAPFPISDTVVTVNGKEVDRNLTDMVKSETDRFCPLLQTYPVKVADGKIEVKLSGKLAPWAVSGLLVYPLADADAAEAVLADIDEEILIVAKGKDKEDFNLIVYKPDASPEDIKYYEGLNPPVVFVRPLEDLIYSNTIPGKADITDKLELFASPDEITAASFAVISKRRLNNFEVSVSDLKSGNDTISSRDIEIRTVRSFPRDVGLPTLKNYAYIPSVLEKNRIRDLNGLQQYWFVANIPKSAKPGIYNGKIVLKNDISGTKEMLLTVNVLPFQLDIKPKCQFGAMIGTPTQHLTKKGEFSKAAEYMIRKLYRDAHQRGINIAKDVDPQCNVDKEGKITVDFEFIAEMQKLRNEEGIRGPTVFALDDALRKVSLHWCGKTISKSMMNWENEKVPPILIEKAKEMYALVRTEWGKRGFGPFIYYGFDEPYNPEMAKAFLEAAKEAGLITLSTIINFRDLAEFAGTADIQSFGGGMKNCELTQKFYEEKPQKQKWYYNNNTLYGKYPNHSRLLWGFYPWRTNADGLMPWGWVWDGYRFKSSTDPNACWGQFMHLYLGEEGVVPSLQSECIRLGINDFRYMVKLESMIAILKEKKLEYKDLENEVSKIREAIDPNYDHYNFSDFINGKPFFSNPVPENSWYDNARNRVSLCIMEAMERLEPSLNKNIIFEKLKENLKKRISTSIAKENKTQPSYMLKNPSFETEKNGKIKDWRTCISEKKAGNPSCISVIDEVPDGKVLKIESFGDGPIGIDQFIPVKGGAHIQVSCLCKVPEIRKLKYGARISLSAYKGNKSLGTTSKDVRVIKPEYENLTLEMMVPEDADKIYLWLHTFDDLTALYKDLKLVQRIVN